MRILLGSAHPYFPELFGGAQTSTHQLASAFIDRGHDVAVLSGFMGRGRFGLPRRLKLKITGAPWVKDYEGYPVFRAWNPREVVAQVLQDFKADVVMLQSGRPVEMAREIAATRTPTVVYLRNVEIDDLGGSLSELENVEFVANSVFTAERFRQTDGVEATVIYPMIDAAKYRTVSLRRNVTFINPHPHKGVDIALAVAERCSDIPFVFVRTWSLAEEHERHLQERTRLLHNVEVISSTRDMKSVYRLAKLVLAPSRWEEAFGRIAAEAHLSGIPVVGSDRGGLPEAIGPGGIIVGADAPVDTWVSAIRGLWYNQEQYEAVSKAAIRYSERAEMDAGAQVTQVLAVLEKASRKAPVLYPDVNHS
nr:glycosyltransferase [uncultured Brevundimonas sp.]